MVSAQAAPGDGPDSVGPERLSWPDRLRVGLVPLLVVGVSAIGTWRYHHWDQTSWRGGTLGMFATIDSPSNRLLRGVTESGEIVLTPASIQHEAQRALVTPTADNLEQLAVAWRSSTAELDLARVEVYRTVFDPSGPSIELRLIRSHQLDRTA